MDAVARVKRSFSRTWALGCLWVFLVPLAWGLAGGFGKVPYSLFMEAMEILLYAPALWIIRIFKFDGSFPISLSIAIGQAMAYSTLLGWRSRHWKWLLPLAVIAHIALAKWFLTHKVK